MSFLSELLTLLLLLLLLSSTMTVEEWSVLSNLTIPRSSLLPMMGIVIIIYMQHIVIKCGHNKLSHRASNFLRLVPGGGRLLAGQC